MRARIESAGAAERARGGEACEQGHCRHFCLHPSSESAEEPVLVVLSPLLCIDIPMGRWLDVQAKEVVTPAPAWMEEDVSCIGLVL